MNFDVSPYSLKVLLIVIKRGIICAIDAVIIYEMSNRQVCKAQHSSR